MLYFNSKIIKGHQFKPKLCLYRINNKIIALISQFLIKFQPYNIVTMELWLKISLQLSIFGFLKEFRPSEPFIFEFLTGEWRNLTETDINQSVFPVGTYSYLTFLIVMFLITDFCRYKPLIVLLGICGIVIWSLFLWTSSLIALQVAEVRLFFYLNLFISSRHIWYCYVPGSPVHIVFNFFFLK